MALTVVQSKAATGNNTAPTVTGLSACGAGNLIVAGLFSADTLAQITYTGWTDAVKDNNDLGDFSNSLEYQIAAGGETSFSFSQSPSGLWNMGVIEVSGQAASPLDVAPTVTATADPTGNSTTCPSEPTGTLAQPNEIVVAFCAVKAVFTSPSESGIGGMTLVDTANFTRAIMAWKIVAATTSLQASFSWTTSGARNCTIATFKEATGGGAVALAQRHFPRGVERGALRGVI